MHSSKNHLTAAELDAAPVLPRSYRNSLILVLGVQMLNAFNDNFVKMLIIAFAGAAAQNTDLGDHLQTYLGGIFSIPYVLFAPLAGWLSDRFSKKWVMFWMQVSQVVVFIFFIFVLWLHQTQLTLSLSLVGFFLIATEAAIFSPSKMGVIKELVGSSRLGGASGALQMTMFVGILSGMWAGGTWFGARLAQMGDNPDAAWVAVWAPILLVTGLAVAQIIGAIFVHATPTHPEVKFQRSVLWEHFAHLRILFSHRPLKLAGLGISLFWFLSNAVATILVGLSRELYSVHAEQAKALSLMAAMLGVGIMGGSLLVSVLCRRRIELALVPIAGAGLTLSLLMAGLLAHQGGWMKLSLILVGISGGSFMTPLYAFVQDRAKPDERARVLSAVNLMDCLAGIAANMVLVEGMLRLGIAPRTQLLVLVPISLCATIFITKLLPQTLLKFLLSMVVRSVYRLRGFHTERLPKEGPLLLVANHVSYADAVVLGALCERNVRFVMFDTLYKLPTLHWFLKIFGTVPISSTKAKEAVRTVAEALKNGDCVCLYPEGQLTRTGFFNRLFKGMELMARLGEARVQPVWIDGLWGSIFSFEGGRFFRKPPKALPYPVSAWFGEPLPLGEAHVSQVRRALLALNAEAFQEREERLWHKHKMATRPNISRTAFSNALRILETALLREHDTIVCLLPDSHPLATVFTQTLPLLRNLAVVRELPAAASGRVVVIMDAATLESGAVPAVEQVSVLMLMEDWARLAPKFAAQTNLYPATYDAASGAMMTLSVPDPEMPAGEEGMQWGRQADSLGHLLPGLAVDEQTDGLLLSNLPGGGQLQLPHATLDEDGFLFFRHGEASEASKSEMTSSTH